MITRHARGKVVWIDLESPSRQELSSVMQEFGIHSRIEEEITSATPYPLVISSPTYVYMVLHFPTTDPSGGAKSQELDFIVGKKFIITARYEVIDSIHNLHKVFEAEELLGLPGVANTSEALLERILRRLYSAIRQELESIGTSLERIERDIFGGKERATVRTISEVNRVLLRFDTTLALHAQSLSDFLEELSTTKFFGKVFETHAVHIEAERLHVAALVDSYRKVAGELRDTNDSLLSSSQNQVMKTLTVITFIILPLSLIASLFQMNIPGIPFSNSPHAFWYVIVTILILSAVLTLFAKKKHWL